MKATKRFGYATAMRLNALTFIEGLSKKQQLQFLTEHKLESLKEDVYNEDFYAGFNIAMKDIEAWFNKDE